VPVSGGVNNSAIFEALPGETPDDLIKYASGFSEAFSGFDNVMISRVDLSEKSYVTLAKKSLKEFKLKPRDSIMVPSFQSDLEPIKEVVLEGMVNRPGKYFISEGETLSSVIRRAGGYKEDAYIFGGALFRKDALEKEKIFAQLNYADTVNYIVSNIGKPNSNINTTALDLLSEELRAQNYSGRVIGEFNLGKITADKKIDILLEDQDRLVIPRMQRIVYLFGDFRSPSNITFDSSLQINDYIKLAGGLKDSAYDEIIVIDPNGKVHLYDKKFFVYSGSIEIYPGSIIYAPRDIGKLSGVLYASTISPILSSLALTLASLNSINN
jgi:polysaccharide export outer membrane protein